MDIFAFMNPTDPTKMEQGQIIDGFKSKLWTERYLTAGEFKFVAKASSGIQKKLPIGSFVSHVDTPEVMIVENHELQDKDDIESDITVTGRGFETFFEQRIAGMNKNYPAVTAPSDYIIPANYTWNQAVTLISDHILAANLIDDNNALAFVTIMTTVPGVGVSEARTIPLGEVYARLLELLAIDNLGIKVIRPGPWSPLGDASPNLVVLIHVGTNRASDVAFSYDTGELLSADYLWSNKKLKNAALISGHWVETTVVPSEVGYARRWMFIKSDLDEALTAAPTGASLTLMINKMKQQGIQALASQKNIALTKTEVSREHAKAVYRKDFDVGDLITIRGDYNTTTTMRVSEYVEVEDENGMQGYPTLTIDT